MPITELTVPRVSEQLAKELNLAALFLPQEADDPEDSTKPCLEVAGVQVYAYVSTEGRLVVAVDTETAADVVSEPNRDTRLEITVNGHRVW